MTAGRDRHPSNSSEVSVALQDKVRSSLGKKIAQAGAVARPREFIATGIAGIDFALGGGFERGTMVELFGESTVGKTLLMDAVLIKNQQEGGLSVKYDAEHAHHDEFFRRLGGSPDDLIRYPNPEDDGEAAEIYVEDVFITLDEILTLKIQEGDPQHVIAGWDSIAATVAKAVAKISLDKANMKYHLAKAVAMSDACPRIMYLLQKTKAILIATNQTRDSPDPFERETKTTGGKSYPFYCSQRIELVRSNRIKSESGEAIGHWIEGTVIKNRLDASLRVFRVPTYTRSDLPHPEFDMPLEPGIHKLEALWEFCYGRKKTGKDDGPTKIFPYMLMPDQTPIVENGKQGYYVLHKHFGRAKPFRKAAWPEVVAECPSLWDLPKVSE